MNPCNQSKTFIKMAAGLFMLLFLSSCATTMSAERYNTQRGAAIGAGLGALLGQAIGRDTGGTLLGAGVGTLAGAIVGNAVDQEYQAVRQPSQDNQVVYMDSQRLPVRDTTYGRRQQTDCRKVTKRTWNKGNLEAETIEEICDGEKNSQDY